MKQSPRIREIASTRRAGLAMTLTIFLDKKQRLILDVRLVQLRAIFTRPDPPSTIW